MAGVNQLIILGGPSAVGKTTLINRLKARDLPELYNQLGIKPSCTFINARNLSLQPMEQVDQLVVHYDFLSLDEGTDSYLYLDELIFKSKSIKVVTLVAPGSALYKRITWRFWLTLFGFVQNPSKAKVRHLRKLWKKRLVYDNAFDLNRIYQRWSTYIADRELPHLSFDSSGFDVALARHYEINATTRYLSGN